MSKELEKPELDQAVESYAQTHQKENLVAHVLPIGLGGAVSALAVGVGASTLIPIILLVTLLFFLQSSHEFNRKAMRAAKSPEAMLAQKEAEAAEAEAKVKSFIESKDLTRAPESEYDCPNYEQVAWDMKLVKEKVIPLTDVSVCSMSKCFLCDPIKVEQAKEAEALRKAEIARKEAEWKEQLREINRRREKRATESDERMLASMTDANAERVRAWHSKVYNKPDYTNVNVDDLLDAAVVLKNKASAEVATCPEHEENKMVETWFYVLCPEHRLEELKRQDKLAEARRKAEAKAAREAAAAEKERQFQERRKVDVMGVKTLRPMEVPEGAVPSLMHGKDIDRLATHSWIVWKWTENGKDTLFFKQPIAIDAYSVSSANGVIKTFYSAHDPETGDYLGEYENRVESEKMKYHTKLMKDVREFNK